MEVSVARSSAVPVVSVTGEVDVYSAPTLDERLSELQRGGDARLVVDLREVGFLDSTGLGVLVEARASAAEQGGAMPIVCNQERVRKLFTITGLDGVFSIHETVDSALAAARA
ncbi:MAG: STAS domain-containing protein [Actinobacteria bacterium]|nr:STAS domain-containing protein [Actinomycetota bacterium]